MKQKVMVFPLLVAAAALAVHGSAGATAASYTDPQGDVAGAGDSRADIIGVDVNYSGGTITMGMTLVNPEAPTSRNWVDGDSGIYWTVFHPSGAEYDVNFSAFDDGLYASLSDDDDKEVCKGMAKAAFGADKRYSVSFPSSCLGDPASFTITSEIGYDDIASGRGASEDSAPDDLNDCCVVTK